MNDDVMNEQPSFRDSVATISKQGKRNWISPTQPKGRLYNLRTLLSIFYLIALISLPFIKINKHPLFLINILERKFILFGTIFWPQDFFIFGLGMVIFIVFIALFTVVFGRVFCGWACPQTIFLEMVFRKIEYAIEGDAGKQKALKASPWNTDKFIKKFSKWIIFWLLSFVFANVFLSYIIGIDELKAIISTPIATHKGGFLAIVIFTSIFFFIYSWFREQVCTVVCPYGRMQGVLLDRNSIVVSYDYQRGEPRAKYTKEQQANTGDCIDCKQCIRVCPTGIDIRNGTQLECVNCTACIDACDHIMESIHRPTNLIKFASERNIADHKPTRFTTKMKAYSVIMLLLLGVEVYLLTSRTDIGITILRTPGQLFQEPNDSTITNLYNYTVLNKTFDAKTIELKPNNFKGTVALVGEKNIQLKSNQSYNGSLFVSINKNDIQERSTKLKIDVFENKQKVSTITIHFLGPFKFK